MSTNPFLTSINNISLKDTYLMVYEYEYDDDDDDVTGIQATEACPNYEAVCARTGTILL